MYAMSSTTVTKRDNDAIAGHYCGPIGPRVYGCGHDISWCNLNRCYWLAAVGILTRKVLNFFLTHRVARGSSFETVSHAAALLVVHSVQQRKCVICV